ncbi:MAG: 1-acyl-sn-glycerol-3-phosphate acyltransferase [Saprospiraceae bacterium]|nr:1-acyl-sn-glycerol-3-phosphate acyltransferase [Saprospiraceae bacterium]
MNSKYDAIRPFYDHEVNVAIQSIMHDPMMTAIMHYTFPDKTETERLDILRSINSTQSFQGSIVYFALKRILAQSSEGLTTSGFEKLDKNTAYLYISNHRDILLDTSLINFTLYEHEMILTASAIGDNLVRMPFLNTLSRINRNFLVLRGLSPRELLQSSRTMSEYVHELLTKDNRSVWIAQREGRTKDGNDATHTGVLKMLSMAAGKENVGAYFKRLRIVPISISYEYDPTDSLKLPELLAVKNNQTYVKHEKEDFNSIMKGLTGQKKRIHISAGEVLDSEMDDIIALDNANQQIKALAQLIDTQIIGHYKLWASNYIAYDLLHETNTYAAHYSEAEKQTFAERIRTKAENNDEARLLLLTMYANPVVNALGH